MNQLCPQIRILMLFWALCLIVPPASAQGAVPSSGGYSFELLAQKAGIIFSGTVIKVEPPAENGSSALITFKVEQGLRGVVSGEDLVVREWAGLWNAASGQRYRVGERVLMFFHATDSGGLTSPVGGSSGRVDFLDPGSLKLSAEQTQALSRSPRLRGLLQQHGVNTIQNAPLEALGFLRALRLIAESQ